MGHIVQNQHEALDTPHSMAEHDDFKISSDANVQEERSRASKAPLRLLERSVFCDRMVFVKAVHHAKQLTPVELEVYDSWFNPIVQMRPQLIPDGFVYLKTNTDTCKRRIEMRRRAEESSIPEDYLGRLQDFHDEWLIESGNCVLPGNIPPKSLVLGGTQMQTTNHLLPARTSALQIISHTVLLMHLLESGCNMPTSFGSQLCTVYATTPNLSEQRDVAHSTDMKTQ